MAGCKQNFALTVHNTVDTVIDKAYVGGIEDLKIEAIVVNQRLLAETHAEIKGATGWVYATSKVDGKNNVTVNVTENAEIAGKNITITADAPEIREETIHSEAEAVANTIVNYVWEKVKQVTEKLCKKVSKIPIIGKLIKWVVKKIVEWVDVLVKYVLQSDAKPVAEVNFSNVGQVFFNGMARVGGGAAGIYVDVFDGDMIETSGLDKDLKDTVDDEHKIPTNITAADIDGDGYYDVVTIDGLYNNDAGSFTLTSGKGDIEGHGTIVSNQYIRDMVITAVGGIDLVLKDLVVLNEDIGAPAITSNASGTDKFTYNFAEGSMALKIESRSDGDVTFAAGTRKDTDIGEGALIIDMNGGKLTTVDDAFIAANDINIKGARQIGENIDDAFNLYVFDIAAFDGTTNAAGTVTLVEGTEAKANKLCIQAD